MEISMGRPITYPIGRSMGRPMEFPMGRPMGRPMGIPMGRPMGRPVGRPMGRPTGAKKYCFQSDAFHFVYAIRNTQIRSDAQYV